MRAAAAVEAGCCGGGIASPVSIAWASGGKPHGSSAIIAAAELELPAASSSGLTAGGSAPDGVVAATEPSAPAPNATEDANVSMCNAPPGSTERVPLIPDRSMGAGWLLVDVARLRADLHAFAPNFAQPLLPYTQPEQVLLRTIATVWALSGCDFVDQVAGVGQVLTSAATTTLDQNIGLADLLKNLLHDDTSSLNATPVVREIVERGVEFLKGRPRTGKRLRETADTTIHRAIWTMLYWANPGAHPKDYEIFGFPSMEQQETVPTTTAIGEGTTTTV